MRRSTRISRASQPDPVKRENRLKSRGTPMSADAGLSVGGIRVTEMNRDTLRKHVRYMGLKPKGPLKADLQHCLCDHLRVSSCNDGTNKGGDSSPLDGTERDCSAKESEGRFGDGGGDGMCVAGARVENGNEVQSVEFDEKVTNEQSPDCVIYEGVQVSRMETGTMSDIFEYLDVSSAKRDGDEMAHDLVKALLLRRAEATAINRKQRWRGGLVSKMNKTELTTALRSFGADDSGKVVLLRARLHKLVRRWAITEILFTENVGGGSINRGRCSHRGGVKRGKTRTPGEVEADTKASVDWHQAADIPPLNRDGDIVGGGDMSSAGDSDGVVVNPDAEILLTNNVGGESVNSERCFHRDGSEGAGGRRAGEAKGGNEKGMKEKLLASGAEDEIRGGGEGKTTSDDTPGEVGADTEAHVDWHQAADIPPLNRDGDPSTPRQADSAVISAGDSDGVVMNPATEILLRDNVGGENVDNERCSHRDGSGGAGGRRAGEAEGGNEKGKEEELLASGAEDEIKGGAEGENTSDDTTGEVEADAVAPVDWHQAADIPPVDRDGDTSTTRQADSAPISVGDSDGVVVNPSVTSPEPGSNGTAEEAVAKDAVERSAGATAIEDASTDFTNDTVASVGAMESEVHPRDGMVEFEALLKGFSREDEREVLEFLKDPTVRPVDPSLPELTTEQEQRLVTATSSPSGWDVDLILALNPFLEQGRQLVRDRGGRSNFGVVPAVSREDVSLNVTASSCATKRPVIDADIVLRNEEGMRKNLRPDVPDDRYRSTRPPSPDNVPPFTCQAPSRGTGSASKSVMGTPSVGWHARGSARIGSRGLKLPTRQDPYRPLVFKPRRSRPSFSGSNRRDESIAEWLGGPVDDADAALGDGGGASGEGGMGMSAEDSQGSRCQARETSRNDVTGSLGVAWSSSLSTIEEAGVREVTVEATPEVESQGVGDSKTEKQREPTVGQGQAELPPIQSMGLPRLAGSSRLADSFSVCADDDGEFGFTFTRCVRTKRGRSSADDGANLEAFDFAINKSDEEFGFPICRPHRVPAAAAKGFTFTRCVRTKRGRSSVDDGANLDVFVSNEDDCSGVFEFATSRSASSRRVRPRGGKRKAKEVIVTGAPSIARESSTLPPQTSTAKGFDMSLYKRAGEWKCETCLVRNPPEQQACLSCEAAKPVVRPEEAAVSGGSGLSAVPTPILGSGLFAGDVPSNNHTFTFGSCTAREMFEGRKEKLLADDDGERNAEFGFPIRRRHRVPAAATKSFAFTRCVRTKRGRSSADDAGDLDAFVSNDDDCSGVFEFATSKSASSRRTRRRVMVPPRVSGDHSSDIAAVMETTRHSSTSSEAPAVKGFDMSLFKKPGEWKCEACLVRNPPGRDACLSCETPKPVVGRGGDSAHSGATAVAPVTPSTIGGALFAGKSPSNNQTFTFGGQPAGDWGSSGHSVSASSGPPSVQRGFVFGASAK